MSEKYTIELGIDGSGINKSLNESISLLTQTEAKAKGMSTNIEKAFKDASRGSETLNNTIKESSKHLEESKKKSEELGKRLRMVFDVKEVEKLEEKIADFKQRLEEVPDKKEIGFELDQSAIEELSVLQQELSADYQEIQEQLSQRASTLSEYSVDAGDNIDYIKERVQQLGEELKNSNGTDGELLSELQSQKIELDAQIDLHSKYGKELKNTEAIQRQLSKAFNQATQEIQNASNVASNLNEEQSKLGGSGGVLSAMFGQVDKMTGGVISKLKGMRGALQGAVVGFNLLKVAIIGTGIGALIVLLGSLIAYFKTTAEGQNTFAKYMNIIGAVVGKVTALMASLGEKIVWVFENPKEALTSFADMIKENITNRIVGLLELIPSLGKSIGLVFKGEFSQAAEVATNAIGKVVTGQEKIIDTFKDMSKASRDFANEISINLKRAEEITRREVALKKDEITMIRERADVEAKVSSLREKANQKDMYSTKERIKMLQDAGKEYDEMMQKRIKYAKDEYEIAKERAKQGNNTHEDEKAIAELYATYRNLESEKAKTNRRYENERRSIRKEASREASEANKRLLDEEKATLEKILEFTRAYQDSRLSLEKESLEKSRKELSFHYDRQIEDIKRQSLGTKEEVIARDKLIEQLAIERNEKLLELEQEYQKEVLKKEIEFKSVLAGLQAKSLTADLNRLEAEHETKKMAIEEQFKERLDLQKELLEALESNIQSERLRIKNEWADKLLKEEEERAILEVELMSVYAGKHIETEEQKHLAILKIKQEYASKHLSELIENGNSENSLEVKRARKVLQDISKALKEEEEKLGGFDMYKFLGFGNLDKHQKELIKKTASDLGSNLKQITDFIISQYDRQIDKKRELIAVYENDLNELERRLEKEKELKEWGFANNVEIVEQEMASIREQKEKEMQEMQEMQKKKRALQKAEFAIDSMIQAQNLITSSSQIFKALSGFGPLGVGMAIALIATMFGAFATSKVKAMQVANKATLDAYETGGLIKGKRHSQGGEKYYSLDGNRIKELEDNEFVINRKSTSKHLPLLEAINSDNFRQIRNNDRYLKRLFSDLGISFQEEASIKTLKLINDAKSEFNLVLDNKNEHGDTKKMIQVLEAMYLSTQESVKTWEDGKYRYVKKGNTISKIKKWKNTDLQ